MKAIEQSIDSREVAIMIEKEHYNLLKDIRRYTDQLTKVNIDFSDFFIQSAYIDNSGRKCVCYKITKKGCEFIANKLTGVKGTAFTARYINKFHDMQNALKEKQNNLEVPDFFRKFDGKWIVTEYDFIKITGVNIKKHKKFYSERYFKGGVDWNGYGLNESKEDFKNKYGFEYGNDENLLFFYRNGLIKAIQILEYEKLLTKNTRNLLIDGIKHIEIAEKKQIYLNENNKNIITKEFRKREVIQINISLNDLK